MDKKFMALMGELWMIAGCMSVAGILGYAIGSAMKDMAESHGLLYTFAVFGLVILAGIIVGYCQRRMVEIMRMNENGYD